MLSSKEALNISLQLLRTVNELPWKCVHMCVFSPSHTLWHTVIIGSYSSRIVQCDGDEGNAAANALPLPIWASLSHKAAVQPGAGGLYLFVLRNTVAEPSGVHTPGAEMCLLTRLFSLGRWQHDLFSNWETGLKTVIGNGSRFDGYKPMPCITNQGYLRSNFFVFNVLVYKKKKKRQLTAFTTEPRAFILIIYSPIFH